jgi:hypothetical protein
MILIYSLAAIGAVYMGFFVVIFTMALAKWSKQRPTPWVAPVSLADPAPLDATLTEHGS